MTRINIGINPIELCDQMLVAEYRELPRMKAFSQNRLDKFNGTGPRPNEFTLGTGHMSYFIPYGKWLENRWESIRLEMIYRDMNCNLTWCGYPKELYLDLIEPEFARELLIERIKRQVSLMKRTPRWTKRNKPSWIHL